MPQRRLFIPFAKVDVERREVSGRLTQEMVDRDGEIWDYKASVPHMMAWSDGFAKATGGKSLGNLRAMHRAISAGKLTAIDYDETNRCVNITAKVVDDAEWNKVDEGVYTGFSLGGNVVRSWRTADDPTHKRFEVKPSEASLADYPAVPTAVFEYVKLGGATETRHFNKVAERADVSPKAAESKYGDVTFADEKNKKYPLDTKARIRNALSRWGNKKNRDKYSAEDQKTIGDKIAAAAKKAGIDVSDKAMRSELWQKGLYDVQELARAVDSLFYLQRSAQAEAEWEDDDSTIPAELAEHLTALIATLEAWMGEECSELLAHIESEKISKTASSAHTIPENTAMADDARTTAWRKKLGKSHIAKVVDIHEHAKAVHKLFGEHVAKIAGTEHHATADAIHKMMGDHCDKIAGFLDEVGGESTTHTGADEQHAEKLAGLQSEFTKVTGERDDLKTKLAAAEKERDEFRKTAQEYADAAEGMLGALDVRKGQLKIVDRATDGDASLKVTGAKEVDEPKTPQEAFRKAFLSPKFPTAHPGAREAQAK